MVQGPGEHPGPSSRYDLEMAPQSGIPITAIVLPLAAIGFVAIWLFVNLILSRASGWHELGKHYRMDSEFSGSTWTWQSGQMGLVGISNCLTIGSNRTGLYLAMMLPFRFQHPPLFVPWSDIAVTQKRSLFRNGVQFMMGRSASVTLWVSAGLAEKIRQSSL